MDAGLEGDKTFYFGEHAVRMRGPVDIDLAAQPPPDLAVEVEVSHSADAAIVAWGRLGVSEVWRFQPKTGDFRFCVRAQDGSYASAERSLAFPMLSTADVLEQLNRANELGADRWNEQLESWVREVIRPRITGGALMDGAAHQGPDDFSVAPIGDGFDVVDRRSSRACQGRARAWRAVALGGAVRAAARSASTAGFMRSVRLAIVLLSSDSSACPRGLNRQRVNDGNEMVAGMSFAGLRSRSCSA